MPDLSRSRPSEPTPPTLQDRLAEIPAAFKAGVVVAILGFLVTGHQLSVTKVNGQVTHCSYTDVVKLGAAVFLGLLVVQGLLALRRRRHRPHVLVTTAFVVILVGCAVWLALLGTGTLNSPCVPV